MVTSHAPEPDTVPPAVRLVRDLINTREPQIDDDRWRQPEQLRDWLADQQLVPVDSHLAPDDLAAATAIREGLRAVLLSHAGHQADPADLDALNHALQQQPMHLAFDDGGYQLLDATRTPFGQAVAKLADAIRRSAEDGTWPRLKVCARDTCRWAFYDASRNRVRRWCSMAGCGNHIKMQRAYRSRKNRANTETPDLISPVSSDVSQPG